MSNVTLPGQIFLNLKEITLLNQTSFDVSECDASEKRNSSNAAAKLTNYLHVRKAIPEIRLRYFYDSKLNTGGYGKSRKDIFEGNGVKGEKIFSHLHFLNILKYFIYGPDLPTAVITGFAQIISADQGTSGMILTQLRAFARAETRRLLPEKRRDAIEEFFKLALECGLDVSVAKSIRDAVRTVK